VTAIPFGIYDLIEALNNVESAAGGFDHRPDGFQDMPRPCCGISLFLSSARALPNIPGFALLLR
jgi:hypothetical protein